MTTVHITFQSGETCTIEATEGLDLEHLCALLSPMGIQQILAIDPYAHTHEDTPPTDDDECPCPVCQRTRMTH